MCKRGNNLGDKSIIPIFHCLQPADKIIQNSFIICFNIIDIMVHHSYIILMLQPCFSEFFVSYNYLLSMISPWTQGTRQERVQNNFFNCNVFYHSILNSVLKKLVSTYFISQTIILFINHMRSSADRRLKDCSAQHCLTIKIMWKLVKIKIICFITLLISPISSKSLFAIKRIS